MEIYTDKDDITRELKKLVGRIVYLDAQYFGIELVIERVAKKHVMLYSTISPNGAMVWYEGQIPLTEISMLKVPRSLDMPSYIILRSPAPVLNKAEGDPALTNNEPYPSIIEYQPGATIEDAKIGAVVLQYARTEFDQIRMVVSRNAVFIEDRCGRYLSNDLVILILKALDRRDHEQVWGVQMDIWSVGYQPSYTFELK